MSIIQKLFIFDTNAHSYLIDNLDSIQIPKHYDKLGNEITILFTKINFFEYLKDINSDKELVKRQKYVNAIFMANGIIYVDPRTHIQHAAKAIHDDDVIEQMTYFNKRISEFLNSKNIAEFRIHFGQEANARESRMNEIAQSGNTMYNKLQKHQKIKRNDPHNFKYMKEEMQNPPNEEWYNDIYASILERYGLTFLCRIYDRDRLFSVLPSLKYFCDVLWRYTREYILHDKKYDPNDYFDFDHIIYLDKVDYLITRDKKLSMWINDCGNPDIAGRAISPENFVEMMNQEEIPKRAPLPLHFG